MSAIAEEDAVYMHGRDRNFTREEYFALSDEIRKAEQRGDRETSERLFSMLPVDPAVVKVFWDTFGKEYILSLDLDLTEANLRFGEGWLDAPNGR